MPWGMPVAHYERSTSWADGFIGLKARDEARVLLQIVATRVFYETKQRLFDALISLDSSSQLPSKLLDEGLLSAHRALSFAPHLMQ